MIIPHFGNVKRYIWLFKKSDQNVNVQGLMTSSKIPALYSTNDCRRAHIISAKTRMVAYVLLHVAEDWRE